MTAEWNPGNIIGASYVDIPPPTIFPTRLQFYDGNNAQTYKSGTNGLALPYVPYVLVTAVV